MTKFFSTPRWVDGLVEWGWTVPLVLSLGVLQIYESRMRPCAVTSALLWGFWTMAVAKERPRWNPVWAVAGMALLLGVAWSAYPARTLEDVALGAGMFVYFGGLAVWLARGPDRVDRLVKGLLVVGAARFVVALVPARFPAINGVWTPVSDNPNSAMVAMALGLILLMGRTLEGRAWRALWWALAAGCVGLALRWNAMAALWGFGFCALLGEYWRKPQRWILWTAAAWAGLVVVGLAGGGPVPDWLRYNPLDPHRWERWRIALELVPYIKNHFLLGTGLGTFAEHYPAYCTLPGTRVANFAHNEWLQFFCEGGLLGGGALAVLAGGLAPLLWKRRSQRPAAVSAVVALFLWSLVYFPFHWELLLFVGTAAVAVALSPMGRVPLDDKAAFGMAACVAVVAAALFMQAAGRRDYGRGLRAWRAGDNVAALGWFESSSRRDPTSPEPHLRRMEILRALEKKSDALEAAQKALRLRPRDVWIRRSVAAGVLHEEGRVKACDVYRPILTHAPRVPQFVLEYEDMCRDLDRPAPP